MNEDDTVIEGAQQRTDDELQSQATKEKFVQLISHSFTDTEYARGEPAKQQKKQ